MHHNNNYTLVHIEIRISAGYTLPPALYTKNETMAPLHVATQTELPKYD